MFFFPTRTLRSRAVSFSVDGRLVVSGSDETIRLWDVTTGREVRKFIGQKQVFAVCFSPDGRYVVSGNGDQYDRACIVWDVSTGNEVRDFFFFFGFFNFVFIFILFFVCYYCIIYLYLVEAVFPNKHQSILLLLLL